MALSTDINLPRSHVADFPNRCVICNARSPASHVRVMTGSIGWWTWLFWWFGKPFVAKAPACTLCGWKLHGIRLLSLLVTIGIVVVILWLIWPHLEDAIPRELRKWVFLVLALTCLAPQLVFEVYFARPFDVTAYADSVDYEFASHDYATDFAMLNGDAEWVKVNGHKIDFGASEE